MTEQETPQAAQEEPLRQEGESVMEAFVRYQRKAFDESCQAIEALIPEGFKVHSREARRAFLMSLKVVAESLAEKFEQAAEAAEEEPPSTTGKTKVRVEVS
jgi:hypothetical protein